MENAITLVALASFVYLVYLNIEFLIGFRLLKNLKQQAVLPNLPSISIIFSALNEEKDIEAALKSMLLIDYPNFEVIVIDDRSTDNTPQIIENLRKQYPTLKVLHVKSLPEGWMGKNHALYLGAQHANSEWLLFTDADVNMKPDTLSKAISYSIENKIDHLTIYENHLRNTFWLKLLLLASYVTYSMCFMPWRIRCAWSKKSLGHGAFNLVKSSAYKKCGGHAQIALECLDDLKLGALIKRNGFKQDTVDGRDYIEREWYSSLQNMITGLKKNAFAYYDYNITYWFIDFCISIIFFIWPICAVFLFSGWPRYLNLANIGLMLTASIYVAEQFRLEKRFAFLYPISIVILTYTLFISVLTVYRDNGVIWRGTHYPLSKLKSKTAQSCMAQDHNNAASDHHIS